MSKTTFVFTGLSPSGATLGDGTELLFHPGAPVALTEEQQSNAHVVSLIQQRILVPQDKPNAKEPVPAVADEDAGSPKTTRTQRGR